ncbi:MAG: MoaD/ThiS family protein [Deltaproteobacteria bacterium]|nr:MoaD/ThiS family protein [Deltaproteobacteria bacterium]
MGFCKGFVTMITVGKEKIPWKPGMTIADALEAIADGHLYAVVRVDQQVVSRPNFTKTTVPDRCEIIPIPMISGG